MPSVSEKQARLMAACAHGADYESCPPKKVAKEFNKADKETGILKKSVTFKEWLEPLDEMKDDHMYMAQQIANKHKVPVTHILDQVRKGTRVEYEHTSSTAEAKKIAFDHLKEKPNYYTALKKMEAGKCD